MVMMMDDSYNPDGGEQGKRRWGRQGKRRWGKTGKENRSNSLERGGVAISIKVKVI